MRSDSGIVDDEQTFKRSAGASDGIRIFCVCALDASALNLRGRSAFTELIFGSYGRAYRIATTLLCKDRTRRLRVPKQTPYAERCGHRNDSIAGFGVGAR
jgi:hypothetical protein